MYNQSGSKDAGKYQDLKGCYNQMNDPRKYHGLQYSYIQKIDQTTLNSSVLIENQPVNAGRIANIGFSMGTQAHKDYPCHRGDRYLARDVYGRDVQQTTLKKLNPACDDKHIDLHTLKGILQTEHMVRPDTDLMAEQRLKTKTDKYVSFAGKGAADYPLLLYGEDVDVSVKENGSNSEKVRVNVSVS